MKIFDLISNRAAKHTPWLLPLWSLVALLASIAKIKVERHNNFSIFRQSFWHFSSNSNLYLEYPKEYSDIYLYGPTFAVLIAPIALLPEPLSFLVWQLMLSTLFFFALSRLPISFKSRLFVGLFSLNEMITALMMQQWNIGIGALLILCLAFSEERKEHWLGLCIAIGLATKLYGIVGLAFFPLAERKRRFALWTILWTALLLALPYAFAGQEYISGSYQEWFSTLGSKSGKNLFAEMQNISLLGIIRKWTGIATYPDLIPIGIGLTLYGIPYLRFKQYKAKGFRLMLLASTLLFTVLFSTGSESSSYTICFPGIALWYLARPAKERSTWSIIVMLGVFILSSLSPTDIFPKAIRSSYIIPYALKALFPSVVWLWACYELTTANFNKEEREILATQE